MAGLNEEMWYLFGAEFMVPNEKGRTLVSPSLLSWCICLLTLIVYFSSVVF